jgi:hypothetical protein
MGTGASSGASSAAVIAGGLAGESATASGTDVSFVAAAPGFAVMSGVLLALQATSIPTRAAEAMTVFG